MSNTQDNTLDERYDLGRWANRIRDAYTLSEATILLRDLLNDISKHYLSKEQVLEMFNACLPEKDKHSHLTRNYCLDCSRRDGFNSAIDQTKASFAKKLEEKLCR